jgi:hypothetical protein
MASKERETSAVTTSLRKRLTTINPANAGTRACYQLACVSFCPLIIRIALKLEKGMLPLTAASPALTLADAGAQWPADGPRPKDRQNNKCWIWFDGTQRGRESFSGNDQPHGERHTRKRLPTPSATTPSAKPGDKLMIRLFVCSALLLGAAGAFAADVLVIDAFEYSDDASAAQTWRTAEDSAPVRVLPRPTATGASALVLPCDFSRQRRGERAVYDRDVALDLVRYGSVVFDFYAEDPAPIRGGTLYFRSGEGWYGAGFGIERGWNRISLGKGAFRVEGNPTGWHRVDGVRIAIWKSRDLDTWCAVDDLHARSESMVVVSGRETGPEAQTARETAERVGGLLSAAGVPHGIHSTEDVLAGALRGRRLAIFAYSPGMQDEEVERIRDFVNQGGKVILFYTMRNDVAALLGFSSTTFQNRQQPGQFDHVVFDTESVMGLPKRIFQGSWNITVARPADDNAQVIGWWQDARATVVSRRLS